MDLLSKLLGLVTGGATTAGGAIANIGAWAAVIAALTPLALWFLGHKDDNLVTISYADAAFWGPLVAVLLFVIVKLAYRAPPPQ